MAIIRRLASLVLLILAAALLVSCVPIPPYDPALAQKGVYVQPGSESSPLPTVAAATVTAAPIAQVEPTAVVPASTSVEPTSAPSVVQVEPTAIVATAVQVEPTGTSAPLAQIDPTLTPVTVTITLVDPSAAQVSVATQPTPPAPTETPVPTLTPTPRFTATSAPTFTPWPTNTVAATPTRAPTMTRAAPATRAPTPTATVDRHLIIITEADIAQAVAGGAGAQQGVTLDNLKVRFTGGKTHITADKLGYGIIKMQNLDLVGSLAAQNGVLSLAVESISPRGLAANFVPAAVNQALANYASQWYVEEVRTLDGRVELRVR